jgi:hypothetical protein
MEDPRREERDPQQGGTTEETPPDTSEHPAHEVEVGGKGAEDPAEMAEEDRYRKGPGW